MENIDTKLMSVNNENKWLINRIDNVFKMLQDELTAVLSRYDEIGTNESDRLKGRRNNILSALGVGLTILLGIYSVDKIDELTFQYILIFILSLGLGIFIFFNMFIANSERLFIRLHNAILQSETQISIAFGYFIGQTANSQGYSYHQLWNWFLMSKALAASMYIPPIEILLSDKGKLFNPDIDYMLRNEGISVLGTLIHFETAVQSFQRESYLQKGTLDFIDNSLKSFTKLRKIQEK